MTNLRAQLVGMYSPRMFSNLTQIIEGHALGHYVQDLRLSDYAFGVMGEVEPRLVGSDFDDPDLIIHDTSHFSAVRDYIRDLPVLSDADKTYWNYVFHTDGNRNITIALLFWLLPNLRSVKSSRCAYWIEGGLVDTMIHRIAEINRGSDPKPQFFGKALSQLREVNIKFAEAERSYLELFVAFAMLPSMRSIKARSLTESYIPAWPHSFPKRSSTVTELCLEYCAVPVCELDAFLSRIASLQIFIYTYHANTNGAEYAAQEIVSLLNSHASGSLHTLQLYITTNRSNNHVPVKRCLGSLEYLTTLKHIKVDDEAFERPEWEPGDEEPLSGEGFYNLEYYQGEQWSMDRLVDVLPRSTEDLTIIQRKHDGETNELFRDMVQLKEERLPNLKLVDFQYENPLDDSMQAALEAMDITITSTKERAPINNADD